MSQDLTLVDALRVILRWKKQIIGATILSGIVAALWSVFVMDEYYYSWATIYPTNQYLNDRSMIFNSENSGGQIDYFGSKADVNRLLSLANSAPVQDYIIDSFKLVEHYDIDRNSKYWKTKVSKKFAKNFKALKTERDALELSVYDTDPKLAANIINTMTEKLDELNKLTVNESKKRIYDLLMGQITQQQAKLTLMGDSLAGLAKQYNIKASTGADGTVVVNGSDFRAVETYKMLLGEQENALKELNNRMNIKEQMEVSMKGNASSLFVVEKAFPADRREKPVRSLIVIVTMLITAFVAVAGALLAEQVSEIRKQL